MRDVSQASALVQDVVSVNAGASVSERIRAAARKLGWDFSRTRDVWYEQARRIDAHEMDQLRAARRARQLEEARKAHAELTQLIAGMEAALTRIDEDFHRESIAGLRVSRGAAAEGMGGVDRAGTEGGAG
jgi:hypothetical protein